MEICCWEGIGEEEGLGERKRDGQTDRETEIDRQRSRDRHSNREKIRGKQKGLHKFSRPRSLTYEMISSSLVFIRRVCLRTSLPANVCFGTEGTGGREGGWERRDKWISADGCEPGGFMEGVDTRYHQHINRFMAMGLKGEAVSYEERGIG